MSPNSSISNSSPLSGAEAAARRHVRRAARGVAAALGLCLTVTLAVDPYGIFNLVDVEGVNRLKVEPAKTERAYAFARAVVAPSPAAIFGSSRAGMGLDPRHPALAAGGPAMNKAISGPNIHEVRVLFDHTRHFSRLRRVVLALDFFMFNAARPDRADSARLERLGGTVPLALLPEFFLSLDALAASWQTVAQQSQSNLTPRRRDGMIESIGRPPAQWDAWREGIGSYAQTTWTAGPEHCFFFAGDGRTPFADLDAMVAAARHDGIDLRIVLSPVHVTLLEGLMEAGLWPQFEDWQRQVLAVAGADVPVWDFAQPSAVTTEPVPRTPAEPAMAGFIDHSHYMPWVGVRVLDRVFATAPDGSDAPPADFGYRLTPEALDAHQARTRALVAEHSANAPRERAEIAAVVGDALAANRPDACRARP